MSSNTPASVHPTAIVSEEAQIHPSTRIGPYCVIEGAVRIGPANEIRAHSFITGHTEIGAQNRIGPHACIGTEPQSIGDFPDDNGVIVGNGNIIREFSQIHRATDRQRPTRVGNRNFIMAGGHIAHDCAIGDGCIITNGAFISGHCSLADGVNVSSPVGVHQHVRIGRLVFISAGSGVGMDVPPFMIVEGRNRVRALNIVGMRRAGIGAAARSEVKRVFTTLYLSGLPLQRALAELESQALGAEAREIVDFCRAESKRGIMPFEPYRDARPGIPAQ